MKLIEALNILERHNKWRRGDDSYPMEDPKRIGIAIDTIIRHLKNETK